MPSYPWRRWTKELLLPRPAYMRTWTGKRICVACRVHLSTGGPLATVPDLANIP